MDWFLYDHGVRHEKVKLNVAALYILVKFNLFFYYYYFFISRHIIVDI